MTALDLTRCRTYARFLPVTPSDADISQDWQSPQNRSSHNPPQPRKSTQPDHGDPVRSVVGYSAGCSDGLPAGQIV